MKRTPHDEENFMMWCLGKPADPYFLGNIVAIALIFWITHLPNDFWDIFALGCVYMFVCVIQPFPNIS